MNTRTEKEEEESKEEGRFDAGVTFHGAVTFHGPMFDIHDNQHVETHVHYAHPGGTAHLVTPSEQRLKEALERLLAATDASGKRIFAQQYQWYAVWKVLQEYQCPKNFQAFAETMQDLLGTTDPPCKAESFRKMGNDVPGAAANLAYWEAHKNKAEGQFKQLIRVALTLKALLAQG